MIEAYQPWEALGPVTVPTPWALNEFGVPVDFVQLPWVAGVDFDAMVRTAQVVATINVREAAKAALESFGPSD